MKYVGFDGKLSKKIPYFGEDFILVHHTSISGTYEINEIELLDNAWEWYKRVFNLEGSSRTLKFKQKDVLFFGSSNHLATTFFLKVKNTRDYEARKVFIKSIGHQNN